MVRDEDLRSLNTGQDDTLEPAFRVFALVNIRFGFRILFRSIWSALSSFFGLANRMLTASGLSTSSDDYQLSSHAALPYLNFYHFRPTSVEQSGIWPCIYHYENCDAMEQEMAFWRKATMKNR